MPVAPITGVVIYSAVAESLVMTISLYAVDDSAILSVSGVEPTSEAVLSTMNDTVIQFTAPSVDVVLEVLAQVSVIPAGDFDGDVSVAFEISSASGAETANSSSIVSFTPVPDPPIPDRPGHVHCGRSVDQRSVFQWWPDCPF